MTQSQITEYPEGATGEGTVESPYYPDVFVQLSGQDGNAFVILGAVRREVRAHLREKGIRGAEAEAVLSKFSDEAMSGDYDNVLQTAMRWVEVG